MANAVTLIAPVAPFRGGVARHSEALARALAARDDVVLAVECFSTLYPSWLYPGKNDRAPSSGEPLSVGVSYSIDTLNPFSWTAAADRIGRRGGIAVIPAWTFFVAPALGTIARRLRKRGMRVIMVVHNIADHEASGWKSRVSNWQLAAADGFITHTENLTGQLRAAGHEQPAAYAAHPTYSDFPAPTGSLPRERGLELLCFGLVRHYKGVDIALRALEASGLDDVRLTIAGEIWEDGETISSLAGRPRLMGKAELINRYVSDQEASELFARCDAVLAPYRSVTGSGVAAMARHFHRPLVASDLPGLREEVGGGQTGWLFEAGDHLALAALLRGHVTREAAGAMSAALSTDGGDEWETFAGKLLDLASAS
jgi:D-inositol-3-phosphate glycosyltransferase